MAPTKYLFMIYPVLIFLTTFIFTGCSDTPRPNDIGHYLLIEKCSETTTPDTVSEEFWIGSRKVREIKYDVTKPGKVMTDIYYSITGEDSVRIESYPMGLIRTTKTFRDNNNVISEIIKYDSGFGATMDTVIFKCRNHKNNQGQVDSMWITHPEISEVLTVYEYLNNSNKIASQKTFSIVNGQLKFNSWLINRYKGDMVTESVQCDSLGLPVWRVTSEFNSKKQLKSEKVYFNTELYSSGEYSYHDEHAYSCILTYSDGEVCERTFLYFVK